MARTWARRGTVPVLRHPMGHWEKLSVVSGVAVRWRDGRLEPRLYFRLLPGRTVKGEDVAAFLGQLARHLKGPMAVVLDNAGPHHAKRLRAWVARHDRFELVHLPPYCPELNPDEGVWHWSKTVDLANGSVRASEELVPAVRSSLRRLQRREAVLRWCLRNADLKWGGLLN